MIKKRRPQKAQKTRKETVPRMSSAKHTQLDLPGFTTAMDGGSAGAAGSGSSKNLEDLPIGQ